MRSWFITGASRGLGALIAAEALASGDAVVATARDTDAVRPRWATTTGFWRCGSISRTRLRLRQR